MKCTDCGSDKHNTGYPACPDRGKGLAKPVVVNKAKGPNITLEGSVTEAKGSVTTVASQTKQERWREKNKERYREIRRDYMRKKRKGCIDG